VRLLALDTSSLACSVALGVDGQPVAERHEQQPRAHTRLLVPMIREVLGEAGLAPRDLDAVVLGNGPGSFIGMRIAASVAQGLAFAADVRVVPVSSLAAVAAAVFTDPAAEQVVVTQDAHMDQVYLGIFERDDGGLPGTVVPERLAAPAAIEELEAPVSGARLAAGEGWARYPALRDANARRIDAFVDVLYPRARDLLATGAEGLRRGEAIEPWQVEPAYLRQKVAAKPGSRP
jgi:tRNA threonylcarbamoyladenosine biosynthesis protein TsaB